MLLLTYLFIYLSNYLSLYLYLVTGPPAMSLWLRVSRECLTTSTPNQTVSPPWNAVYQSTNSTAQVVATGLKGVPYDIYTKLDCVTTMECSVPEY